MQLSKEEVRQTWHLDKRQARRRMAMMGGALLLVFLLCISIRYNAVAYTDKFVPLTYLKSFWTAIKLLFARILDSSYYYRRDEIINAIGSINYLGAIARLKTTLMTGIAGAALAIGGAVFQTAYRNPMASPNLLGVTAGVNLGNIAMVMIFSTAAANHVFARYRFCYAFTAGCVLVVLLLGKLAGDKLGNYFVMEMVMAGAIVSQGINAFVTYFMYTMEDEELELYEQINLGAYLQIDTVSFLIFISVMAVGIIPILLLRYQLNALGMDGLEGKSLGLHLGVLRVVAQICGVLMVTAAMVHCGEIGMITMVVPYLVRGFAGADFRRVCVYSAMLGAMILMPCALISSFILIVDTPLPATFIINIVLTPVFVVMMAKHRGGFHET